MALNIKFARPTRPASGRGLALLAGLLALFVLATLVASLFSAFTTSSTAPLSIERLKQPIFANTAKIYAAPREVRPGQSCPLRSSPMNCARPATPPTAPRRPSPLGTYSRGRAGHHGAARPAVLPRAGRRHHPHLRGRRGLDHRRPRPAAFQLRAGAAADHRPERRRQPHQAPPDHLRRDSAEPGAGCAGHRGPPLL